MNSSATTRLIRGGRLPKTRDAIYAVIQARPGEGLTSTRVAEIVGCTPTFACDCLRVLRERGFVAWLILDRHLLHFASAEYRDLYAQAHQVVQSGDAITLAGFMEARRARVLELLGQDLPLGLSAKEIAAELGISAGSMRYMLLRMESAGEAFRGGDDMMYRWFGSAKARNVAAPLLAVILERQRQEASAILTEGRMRSAAAKSAMKQANHVAARIKMQRVCAVKPSPERVRPAPAPVHVEIVGITDDLVQRIPTPRGRFEPEPGYVGEFALLKVGRYIS